MRILYCGNPLTPNEPDDFYVEEAECARATGFEVSIIDFEALTIDGNANRATRRLTTHASNREQALYRGWMMTPDQYSLLFDSLAEKGIDLINTPEAFKHCHHLPEWLPLLVSSTPQTKYIERDQLTDNWHQQLKEILAPFEGNPVIVKDYVKSQKHHWLEACYIPNSADTEHAQKVAARFLDLRGEALEGGLVFRQFEKFKTLTTHSKSGMPLTREYRLFVANGKIFHWFNYWEEGEYEDALPPIDNFAELAKRPGSKFYTMDIAQKENGDWLIVELGDGQVAGLPENASVPEFYRDLKAVL